MVQSVDRFLFQTITRFSDSKKENSRREVDVGYAYPLLKREYIETQLVDKVEFSGGCICLLKVHPALVYLFYVFLEANTDFLISNWQFYLCLKTDMFPCLKFCFGSSQKLKFGGFNVKLQNQIFSFGKISLQFVSFLSNSFWDLFISVDYNNCVAFVHLFN